MAQNLEEVISRAVDRPIGISEIPDILQSVQEQIWINSALSATADDIEGAALVSRVVAALVATPMLILMLFIVLIATIVTGLVSEVLQTVVGRIPWVGGKLAGYVHIWFGPRQALANWSVRQAAKLVSYLWADCTTVIGYFASRYDELHPQPTHYTTTQDTHKLTQEINNESNRIDHVQAQLNSLSAYVHNQPSATYVINQTTLPEQLHAIQGQIHTLYINQEAMYTDVKHIVADLNALLQDVKTLSASLVGTRAVVAGYTDFETRTNDAIKRLDAVKGELQPEIQANTRSIAHLAPLSLLLEPGMPGLRNLRKLEDDMCQCPKFKGIGNDLGTEAAIELIVAHGV